MIFERAGETFTGYAARTDPDRKTITLTQAADQSRRTEQLQRVDHAKLLLLSRDFNWIQEYPFNR